ncbi:dirigent protein 25-like [Nicotiana tomentosiformis]|uniref:dirigent protein 25-like n=1 Tax=Nicotiana tomentosiformis TaxID=4098 RepID=UPI00051B76AF|nr:dirigent protein 25-like [Nicotiana tomentosiformis]
MATSKSKHFQLKAIFTFLLVLALTITSTTARRILDEEPTTPTVAPEAPDTDEAPTASGAVVGTGVAAPIGAGAAPGVATPAGVGAGIVAPTTHVGAGAGVAAPAEVGAGVATPAGVSTNIAAPTGAEAAGVTAHVGSAGAVGVAAPVGGAGAATAATAREDDHIFSFFMHDILGGSNPSAIAVTGIATNPSLSGQVPFAKPNGAVLAVDNGVPVNSNNNGIISNNNIPFLTGLSGTTSNVIQNNGNNNIIGGGSGFPALNMAQLGSGITFQKLMFGTLTVFDDELTESHELNSGLVGKAQGFYVASSEDGNSQTMAFTVMFHSGSYSDSLTFFGVHRTRVSESHLAIMGGTGKYVNAKGFATVKTFPAANQQETDGVQTLLHITVYLAY